jgi:hypothetical protein
VGLCRRDERLYYQYEDLKLVLLFRESDVTGIDYLRLAEELRSYSGRQSLFNASVEQFDAESMTLDERLKRRYEFGLKMRLEGFQLSGKPVESVEFSGVAQLREIEMRLPVAMGYGSPHEELRDAARSSGRCPIAIPGSCCMGRIIWPPSSTYRGSTCRQTRSSDMRGRRQARRSTWIVSNFWELRVYMRPVGRWR